MLQHAILHMQFLKLNTIVLNIYTTFSLSHWFTDEHLLNIINNCYKQWCTNIYFNLSFPFLEVISRSGILDYMSTLCIIFWGSVLLFSPVKVLVIQSCPPHCDPMDCSPPGSSVPGILQARVLEWVVITFSKASSQPRNGSPVSRTAGRFFLPSEPQNPYYFTFPPVGKEQSSQDGGGHLSHCMFFKYWSCNSWDHVYHCAHTSRGTCLARATFVL